ncbi:Ca2+-dependent phosphoinositide-specific phospholipase C [Porticoccus sp. W117]|uniref:Ca2+-dependent phosphoinositide-specific phospholipase C n=1 Tax=Porticoccus sp. W117 TaxID=3054777 RepID=UPI0025916CEB|nr:Ca2+-dependent phosphoinositide-specific phospholipase C [Porticoccus sp. W117]MDM3872210.1 Ca2+-dependent phosphoinositide-specific phospholipase C [Porticoccus sp. W117]
MIFSRFIPTLALLVGGSLVQAGEFPELSNLRLNQLQYISTHNSYHIEPEQTVDLILLAEKYGDGTEWHSKRLVRSLTYTHFPLEAQLDLGIRSFEIDLYADPEGGRYSDPGILNSIRKKGLIPKTAYDPDDQMVEPGFKVLHMQDIDVRSHCMTFLNCLSIISDWSINNPEHLPIIIQLEAKEGARKPVDKHYTPVEALEFSPDLWKDVEKEVLTVFPRKKLLTPGDLIGQFSGLKEAVVENGWPKVKDLRGKVLFLLIHPGKETNRYLGDDRSLKTKLFFANHGNDSSKYSTFMMFTKPQKPKHRNQINRYVKKGFLAYTRADANTEESRRNDTRRKEKAFASGAQIVSTDYPYPDYRFSNYKVQFPGGVFVRCNPVTAKDECKSSNY